MKETKKDDKKQTQVDKKKPHPQKNVKPKETIQSLKEEKLRALAALENYRKDVEKRNAYDWRFRSKSLLEALIPTLDMFEQVLSNKDVKPEIKNYLVGFEMIHQGLNSSLEAEGMKIINPTIGDEYDYKLHEAIEMIESNKKPNTILKIQRKGYMLHDIVIRPAIVEVAKPKTTKKEQEKGKEIKNKEGK